MIYDLLGMNEEFRPRFVKRYENFAVRIRTAIDSYIGEVRSGAFPVPSIRFRAAKKQVGTAGRRRLWRRRRIGRPRARQRRRWLHPLASNKPQTNLNKTPEAVGVTQRDSIRFLLVCDVLKNEGRSHGRRHCNRELSRTVFQDSFAKLQPVILAEWAELDPVSLSDTGGDLDKVIALVAERTAHQSARAQSSCKSCGSFCRNRRVVVRRRGHRLLGICAIAKGLHNVLPESADELLRELEERTSHILKELRGGVLKDTRVKVRENLLFSLLVTLGLGFIIGVLFTGWGPRRPLIPVQNRGRTRIAPPIPKPKRAISLRERI